MMHAICTLDGAMTDKSWGIGKRGIGGCGLDKNTTMERKKQPKKTRKEGRS
jgi:hypothetical protein